MRNLARFAVGGNWVSTALGCFVVFNFIASRTTTLSTTLWTAQESNTVCVLSPITVCSDTSDETVRIMNDTWRATLFAGRLAHDSIQVAKATICTLTSRSVTLSTGSKDTTSNENERIILLVRFFLSCGVVDLCCVGIFSLAQKARLMGLKGRLSHDRKLLRPCPPKRFACDDIFSCPEKQASK